MRLFANYLTPRKGFLSGDTWRAIAVVSRNLLLTWSVLLPLLFVTILVGELFFLLQPDTTWLDGSLPVAQSLRRRAAQASLPLLMLVGWLIALTATWAHYSRTGTAAARLLPLTALPLTLLVLLAFWDPRVPGQTWRWPVWWMQNETASTVLVLLWLVCTVGLVAYARRNGNAALAGWELRRNRVVRVHATLLVVFVVALFGLSLSGFGYYLVAAAPAEAKLALFLKRAGAWIAGISSVAGSIFTAYKGAPAGAADQRALGLPSMPSRVIFALTPPLVLIVLGVLAAWLAHLAVAQLQFSAITHGTTRPILCLSLGTLVGVLLCFAFSLEEPGDILKWAVGLLIGVVTYALLLARLRNLSLADWFSYRDWIGLVLLAGLCTGVVFLGRRLIRGTRDPRPLWLLGSGYLMLGLMTAPSLFFFQEVGPNSHAVVISMALGLLGATLSWVLAIGWSTDPNVVSLHTFYKTRLVRAYLGASNSDRGAGAGKQITEADPRDDMPLRDLRNCDLGGPYHLVNTTLNLVGGRDLTTAQRSSDGFLLSKLYCGSTRSLYRRTDQYMGGELSLGTAVAISGAAVSPNMGSTTPSAALAMLMTLLNIRLGYWAPTPNKARWQSPNATLWPFYVLREFLSQTNELSGYCYLTDGGHFDNTGLYRLIERGCRYIVLADCGADPLPCFSDLGNVIRRCRIDFGTEVSVDIDGFLRKGSDMAEEHFAVGRICYSVEHARRLHWPPGTRLTGTVILFKPALTGAEPPDVRQYGLENRVFPQQTTSDQWFDEAQFESYRRLGHSYAGAIFRHLEAEIAALQGAQVSGAAIANLFETARARYGPTEECSVGIVP